MEGIIEAIKRFSDKSIEEIQELEELDLSDEQKEIYELKSYLHFIDMSKSFLDSCKKEFDYQLEKINSLEKEKK